MASSIVFKCLKVEGITEEKIDVLPTGNKEQIYICEFNLNKLKNKLKEGE